MKYPIGIQRFEKLCEEDWVYVDKTVHIYNLVQGGTCYFLSRPRRFGKSMLLSTLEAYFQGKKHLFKGLAIEQLETEWAEHAVLHIDLNAKPFQKVEDLYDLLNDQLTIYEKMYDSVAVDKSPEGRLRQLIRAAKQKTGRNVVVLVDEYDKPILENISSPDISAIRDTLADFYSSIKKEAECERFVFITGVSKFCHVSLFSKLNNLTDITMDTKYATMFGYTQDELEANFGDRIAALAGDTTIDTYKTKIKEWYNGYRFHKNAQTVYNPVSLAYFFENNGEFNNYWFSTGTPSFLLELIKKQRFDLEKVLETPVSGFAFSAYEIDKLNPLTLLLQTGYLTIDKAVERYGDTAYMLRFPNLEVKGSFEAYLTGDCSGLHVDQVKDSVYKLADKVSAGDVDGFLETMKVFFAKVSYDVHMKNENNFQLLFYSIFMLLGISIVAESRTNNGRIDAVATNEDFVFIFEFKLNKSDEIALQQIKERDYYRRYMNSDKKIFLIGVNFDGDAAQIDSWTYETV